MALSSAFGVEVRGIDLRRELSADERAGLDHLWQREALLLFRGQDLSDSDLDRFASIFGTITFEGVYGAKPYVSNIVAEGLVPEGPLRFHSDLSFTPRPLRG